MKFRLMDYVSVIKGSYNNLQGHVKGFTKANRVLLNVVETSRSFTKKSRRLSSVSYRSFSAANLRHVDSNGDRTKIRKVGKGRSLRRIYVSTNLLVYGDMWRKVSEKRRSIKSRQVSGIERNSDDGQL